MRLLPCALQPRRSPRESMCFTSCLVRVGRGALAAGFGTEAEAFGEGHARNRSENDDGDDVFVAFDPPLVIGEVVGIERENRWRIVAGLGDYQELMRR